MKRREFVQPAPGSAGNSFHDRGIDAIAPAWQHHVDLISERRGGLTLRRLYCSIILTAAVAAAQSAPSTWEEWVGETPADHAPAGVALTPPMGWNSWNRFGCNVNEAAIRAAADGMAASGMKDAGYQYVVIDGCWTAPRDPAGKLRADPVKFPSGIQALADYVHSKGLKFGIYTATGFKDCAGYPSSRGYEFQDARQFAAWGVDYLKLDSCGTPSKVYPFASVTMREALLAAGRPILFSLCGGDEPWLWGARVGSLLRTANDIKPVFFDPKHPKQPEAVLDILDDQAELYPYAGPGHWNDPDMLQVGNGMTEDEDRAHFSLWAILAAPLIAGNDLAHMSEATRAILTNREVIAIDQDPLGMQGRRVAKNGDSEVWVRELTGGSRAVALLNRSLTAHQIQVEWERLGYARSSPAEVRDIWAGKNYARVQGKFGADVAGHGIVLLTVRPD